MATGFTFEPLEAERASRRQVASAFGIAAGRRGRGRKRARRAREVPRALDAAHHTLDVALVGRVGYYVDAHAAGRPIVLVHAPHLLGSAYDVRPLFDALRGERPVYAPDLPGFGTSERGPNQYSPALYARALRRFLIDVVSPRGEPVDVVALSLAGELVARVAIDAPALFRTITLISPTGLGRAHGRGAARLERVLRVPLWARPIHRVLTSRLVAGRVLRRRFAGPVPRDYIEHAVRSARVPGAHAAPAAVMAGSVATRGAFEALHARLRVPTLVLYDRDPRASFERLEELARANPAVRARRIAGTRGMPHFERRDEVLGAMRELWEETRRGEEAEARA